MSFILDALRKSDQLRQRGAAPTLMLGQATPAAPKQPALLVYGLVALVLLGAGIAIGWLRPWQLEPAPPPVAIATIPSAAGQSQLPAPPPDIRPKPEPQPKVQKSALATPALLAAKPAPAPVPAAASAPAAAPAPAAARAQPQRAAGTEITQKNAPPGAVTEASTKATAPVLEQTVGTGSGAAGAAPRATVMAMAELPVAIQQELPPMSISVHAYSNKTAERLVGINNRLLHEGDYVASGLRLEQITPDGMILSYKGYSFRRGVH